MFESEETQEMQHWLASRPATVQRLAAEFPPGSHMHVAGTVYYLVGYTETDELIVSVIDPAEDYAAACAHREYLCAAHVRPQP